MALWIFIFILQFCTFPLLAGGGLLHGEHGGRGAEEKGDALIFFCKSQVLLKCKNNSISLFQKLFLRIIMALIS